MTHISTVSFVHVLTYQKLHWLHIDFISKFQILNLKSGTLATFPLAWEKNLSNALF